VNITLENNGTAQAQIIEDGTTIGALLTKPAIKAWFGLPDQFHPLCNGQQVATNHILNEGNRIGYTPIASSKAVKTGKKAKGGKKSK
jgi:hypothetical protein